MVPAPTGEHAYIAQQLAVLLDGPARAAGLVPTMHQFNVGESAHDFRVPDGGLHRGVPRGVWHGTAALLVEIISPDDESEHKLPFYAVRGVDEVMLVDPAERTVTWLALDGGEYQPVLRSTLIELGPAEVAASLDWP